MTALVADFFVISQKLFFMAFWVTGRCWMQLSFAYLITSYNYRQKFRKNVKEQLYYSLNILRKIQQNLSNGALKSVDDFLPYLKHGFLMITSALLLKIVKDYTMDSKRFYKNLVQMNEMFNFVDEPPAFPVDNSPVQSEEQIPN